LPLYFIESAKPKAEKYETIHKILTGKQGLRQVDVIRNTGYSKKVVQQITADLEEQGLAFYDSKEKLYYSRPNKKGKIYLEEYDLVRQGKLEELDAMMEYGDGKECLSGFLTRYLGDPAGYQCGVCGNCNPSSRFSQPDKSNVQKAIWFLKSDYPRLEEKRGSHTAGVALALHGKTDTGAWVSACKYKTHAPFPPHLVEESVNVLRKWYPMNEIDCIMAVPSTLSGSIVENFAKQIAVKLNIPFSDELVKKHPTQPQKEMTNYVQKKDNVKDVFTVKNQTAISNKRIVLIDDIYDSGQTLNEIGRVLMKHNAKIVYPFTITKTLHSDRD
jgi:ATP-dependent DNA helicase RecQ